MKQHSPEDTDTCLKGRGCTRLRNRNEAKGSLDFTSFRCHHVGNLSKVDGKLHKGSLSYPLTQTEVLIVVQTPESE